MCKLFTVLLMYFHNIIKVILINRALKKPKSSLKITLRFTVLDEVKI